MMTILALALVAALAVVGVGGLIASTREQERQLAIATAKLRHPAGKGRSLEHRVEDEPFYVTQYRAYAERARSTD